MGRLFKFQYMQINMLKSYGAYKVGPMEVPEERGNYLVRIGAAEVIDGPKPVKKVAKVGAPKKAAKAKAPTKKRSLTSKP